MKLLMYGSTPNLDKNMFDCSIGIFLIKHVDTKMYSNYITHLKVSVKLWSYLNTSASLTLATWDPKSIHDMFLINVDRYALGKCMQELYQPTKCLLTIYLNNRRCPVYV